MADLRGESQAVARLLARCFNGHTHKPAPGDGASDVTMETMTGHAIRLCYGDRFYVVLVVPEKDSPLMRAEFKGLGQ